MSKSFLPESLPTRNLCSRPVSHIRIINQAIDPEKIITLMPNFNNHNRIKIKHLSINKKIRVTINSCNTRIAPTCNRKSPDKKNIGAFLFVSGQQYLHKIPLLANHKIQPQRINTLHKFHRLLNLPELNKPERGKLPDNRI